MCLPNKSRFKVGNKTRAEHAYAYSCKTGLYSLLAHAHLSSLFLQSLLTNYACGALLHIYNIHTYDHRELLLFSVLHLSMHTQANTKQMNLNKMEIALEAGRMCAFILLIFNKFFFLVGSLLLRHILLLFTFSELEIVT